MQLIVDMVSVAEVSTNTSNIEHKASQLIDK